MNTQLPHALIECKQCFLQITSSLHYIVYGIFWIKILGVFRFVLQTVFFLPFPGVTRMSASCGVCTIGPFVSEMDVDWDFGLDWGIVTLIF